MIWKEAKFFTVNECKRVGVFEVIQGLKLIPLLQGSGVYGKGYNWTSSYRCVAMGFENLGTIKLSSLSHQEAQIDAVLDKITEIIADLHIGNEPKCSSDDDRFTTVPGALPEQYFSYPNYRSRL
jgi:hypothetical protein